MPKPISSRPPHNKWWIQLILVCVCVCTCVCVHVCGVFVCVHEGVNNWGTWSFLFYCIAAPFVCSPLISRLVFLYDNIVCRDQLSACVQFSHWYWICITSGMEGFHHIHLNVKSIGQWHVYGEAFLFLCFPPPPAVHLWLNEPLLATQPPSADKERIQSSGSLPDVRHNLNMWAY